MSQSRPLNPCVCTVAWAPTHRKIILWSLWRAHYPSHLRQGWLHLQELESWLLTLLSPRQWDQLPSSLGESKPCPLSGVALIPPFQLNQQTSLFTGVIFKLHGGPGQCSLVLITAVFGKGDDVFSKKPFKLSLSSVKNVDKEAQPISCCLLSAISKQINVWLFIKIKFCQLSLSCLCQQLA